MSDIDQFAQDTLRLLGPAPDNWVPQRDGIDHNVVVVGGGQGGSAIAHALRRAGIGGVSVIDAAADASTAGVWLTRARMHKLRTLKSLVGPELGITALGFQQWFEARHGRDAFAALDRIPRADWAAYIAWFREFLDIDVRHGTRLVDIAPWENAGVPALRVTLEVDGVKHFETTRKLILANGVAGNGAPYVPGYLQAAVQAGLAAHTADAIDFAALHGKTVAVIGAIHVFNPAGYASTGVPLGDIPSMRCDIPRIVSHVSHDLFAADLELHQARALADVAPDFGPELYEHAVWRG